MTSPFAGTVRPPAAARNGSEILIGAGEWEELQIGWRPGRGLAGGAEAEWLVTNGLGGFACGTVAGTHTRRYHGWLIAALDPPVDRRLLWVKAEERILGPMKERWLSVNEYGGAVHPDGWRYLAGFRVYPFPTWTFLVDGIVLERTIFMVFGQNTTVAVYRLIRGPSPVEISLDLLVNCRDYHHTLRANGWPFRQHPMPHGTWIEAYPGAPPVCLAGGPKGRYEPDPAWHYDFRYRIERERGLDWAEDHFRPGRIILRLDGPGDEAAVVAHCPVPGTANSPPAHEAPASLARWATRGYRAEAARRRALVDSAPFPHPDCQRLAVAAGDFLARRKDGAATIVAGYPWFADWGRDAMISLPGLLLATGRLDTAREVLLTFAEHRRDGLLPNRFDDSGRGAEYNAVDGPLWFVYAVWKYAQAGGDRTAVRSELLPAAVDILEHYVRGTRYGIRVDGDGLVCAGEPGVQLTWMDAKAGEWVVTPRAGFPVEVNALWYNALRAVESLATRLGLPGGSRWGRLAASVRKAFRARFRHPQGWLYDVVGQEGPEAGDIRPNQLFAAALPFPVLSPREGSSMVDWVASRLLTPVGVRTLDPGHPDYRGTYGGNQIERDGAYHQGTVWPWLLGPFANACLTTRGRDRGSRAFIQRLWTPLSAHLSGEGALGQVSEIFDGDPPHEPRGCFAQAWSVAEWLRIWSEELARPDPPGETSTGGAAREGAPSARSGGMAT
ncbi:MAG: glycogen debranching enzyme family protein [Firmicutes bacterium]|nr:glycogen debranching enzyme family protein [Bacillota bacterium]